MSVHITAAFEYAAVRDVQATDADVADELTGSLDTEIAIAVYISRDRSAHDQVAGLDITLHVATLSDDHIARGGNLAVNTAVDADISGALQVPGDGRFPSDNRLNIPCRVVDMFFHAAEHGLHPFSSGLIRRQDTKSD